MKDSNVGWIGTIPEDWNIARLKYYLSLNGRIGWQGLTANEYQEEGPYLITGVDFDNGGINWDGCVHVPDERYNQASEIMIKNGDLLITKDGTVGKIAMVQDMPDKTTLNSGVMVIRNKNDEIDLRFLYYVLQSEEFWRWFGDVNAGATTITHLYQHDFCNFKFAFPKLSEQKKIVLFLDEQIKIINNIINTRKTQIEILEEAKMSTIVESIKYGIDGETETKNSEEKYIDKILARYEIKKLKYVSTLKTGTTPEKKKGIYEEEEEGLINWHTPGDIDSFELTEANQYIDPQYIQPFPENSIYVITIGATLGKMAVEPSKAYCNQQITVLMPHINSRYLLYSLYSNVEWLKLISSATTLAQLNNAKFGSVKIVIAPDEEEQEKIANYLDMKCKSFDKIISTKKNQIEILEKHKQSLIFDYVTGAKRV